MKIDKIKINGFGKLRDREIELKEGINVIYGENEAGKSTILKFIEAMFYGIAKTKRGKPISDFEQYVPWDGGEFSGKIQYTLENGEQYEVFREFKKKNPQIYNQFNEDISKEFSVGKTKEIDFFEKQMGVDEVTFSNTAMINQQEIKLEKADTNRMVQKISNLVSTGDDKISFQKSMEKLNKMQNEQVGTERTKQKPINVVESKIKSLTETKKELLRYQENQKNPAEEQQKLNEKLEKKQAEKSFLKELKQFLEEEKMKNVALDLERNLLKEYLDKVNKLEKEIELEAKEDGKALPKNKKYRYAIAVWIILWFVLLLCFRSIAISLLAVIPGIVLGICWRKSKKAEVKRVKQTNQVLIKEYESSKETYEKKKQEVEEKEKCLHLEKKEVLKSLTEKYKTFMNWKDIEEKCNVSAMQIELEMEQIEQEISQIHFQKHVLESKKVDLDAKLEELTKIEEELQEQIEQKEELMALDASFCLAKECLEKAYEEIKQNISPKFQQKLCEITTKITNGKYKNVSVNDETGLSVEVENGDYKSIERLSVGTIDEMYLALRLSILSEVAKESLPILLDEAFAYFDENRLENIICYLQDQNYENQILIFTCSHREENALNALKIEYHLIDLEKLE